MPPVESVTVCYRRVLRCAALFILDPGAFTLLWHQRHVGYVGWTLCVRQQRPFHPAHPAAGLQLGGAVRIAEAQARGALQAAADERLALLCQRQVAAKFQLRAEDAPKRRRGRPADEGRVPADHLVCEDPYRPPLRRHRVRLPADNLRRDVLCRAHKGGGSLLRQQGRLALLALCLGGHRHHRPHQIEIGQPYMPLR